MDIKLILNIATVVLVAAIIIAAFWANHYINKQKEKRLLNEKRRWIESLPSLVSTGGVLGTFIGITIGLWFFDTNDLNTSIPLLLSGLSTAFFTSLAGMISSMLLSRKVSALYDKQENGVSDINQAAALITKAVAEMKSDNQNVLGDVRTSIELQAANQKSFYLKIEAFTQQLTLFMEQEGECLKGMSDSLDKIANDKRASEILDSAKLIVSSQKNISEKLDSANAKNENLLISIGNMQDRVESIDKNIAETKTNIGNLTDTIGDIATATESTSNTQDSILEKFDTFGKFIGDEVDDIERKMGETNTLLTSKFDEFSELLKKSNTEALVGVMKQLTVEFQAQMNSLIQRLVKENFEQLNQSVERLNLWQQENKQQIASLIQQYKDMESDFENSSSTLAKVSDDTKTLVSEGGKLQQLIDALNQVILEDKSYMEITKKLQETADLTKDNMVKFDDSTSKLNEWVRKQRDFVDSVQMLMAKLEEIGKIKDYGGEFWKETKNKMEEGVGIIKNGSQVIESQLTNLDERFYQRLSATLAQLDACIQAMVKASKGATF